MKIACYKFHQKGSTLFFCVQNHKRLYSNSNIMFDIGVVRCNQISFQQKEGKPKEIYPFHYIVPTQICQNVNRKRIPRAIYRSGKKKDDKKRVVKKGYHKKG